MIRGGYKLLNNAELGSGLFLANCCPTGTSAKLANASNYFTIILQAALLALKSQIPRSSVGHPQITRRSWTWRTAGQTKSAILPRSVIVIVDDFDEGY